MRIKAPEVQPSRRGEVIAFATLVLTALLWFAQDRQDKGAMQKTNESLERRVEFLEQHHNCQP